MQELELALLRLGRETIGEDQHSNAASAVAWVRSFRQTGACMSWCYELRGSENRLFGAHSGFKSEKAARLAGQYAQGMIDCISYPNSETLTVVTKQDDSTRGCLAQMPNASAGWFGPQFTANPDFKVNLKYPWQQRALDAFLEPDPKNQLRKISIADQAISDRLLDPAPFEGDERTALEKLLPVLRILLRAMAEPEEESRNKISPDSDRRSYLSSIRTEQRVGKTHR